MSKKMNRTEGSKRLISILMDKSNPDEEWIDILDRLSNECNHQIELIAEANAPDIPVFKNITEILVWLGAKYTAINTSMYTTNDKKGQPITSDGIGILPPSILDYLVVERKNISITYLAPLDASRDRTERPYYEINDVDTIPLYKYITKYGIDYTSYSREYTRGTYMIVGDYFFSSTRYKKYSSSDPMYSSAVISVDGLIDSAMYKYDKQGNESLYIVVPYRIDSSYVLSHYITITNPTHISMIKSWTLGNDVTLVK